MIVRFVGIGLKAEITKFIRHGEQKNAKYQSSKNR